MCACVCVCVCLTHRRVLSSPFFSYSFALITGCVYAEKKEGIWQPHLFYLAASDRTATIVSKDETRLYVSVQFDAVRQFHEQLVTANSNSPHVFNSPTVKREKKTFLLNSGSPPVLCVCVCVCRLPKKLSLY